MPVSHGFRSGTRISTDRGEMLVDELQTGDQVITHLGDTRPVRRVVRRGFASAYTLVEPDSGPILVRAGALDDDVPRRDVWLSPQQCLYVDGALIPAKALDNGVSILGDHPGDDLVYFHVECDQPVLIVAEGAPTASYMDESAHNECPRSESAAFACNVPWLDRGAVVETARRRLAARADPQSSDFGHAWRGHLERVSHRQIQGWAHDDSRPGQTVTLHISSNGQHVGEVVADLFRSDLKEAGIGEGNHAFAFDLPDELDPRQRHLIEVRYADDGHPLHGSPQILEAPGGGAPLKPDSPARWTGYLDTATRERLAGWAFDDERPNEPLALLVFDNGVQIGRILANRHRQDLASAGMGDGRHAFATLIPGGLSPLTRHVVEVVSEVDGCAIPGSPVIIEAVTSFDAALQHTVSTAISGLTTAEDCERALNFLAAETERLLQSRADAVAGREARLVYQQFQRRWGAGADPTVLASATPGPRALVIDDRVPVPGRDAGSGAILSHMRALQALGYEVSFIAAEELAPSAADASALEALHIQCCRKPYYASVEEVLRRQHESFALVYLHRVSTAAKYLTIARRYCHRARIIYSVADLHNLRFARQASVQSRPELLAQSRRLRLAECSAASSADAVITHSVAEAAWLRQSIPHCNVHVVPWAVPMRRTHRPWSERHGIAFVGGYAHAPNVDAAHCLVEHILPLVWRENPSIECLLVGSDMPDSIRRLAASRVIVRGHVTDLDTVYDQIRLTVAPLRYGAGVKGKVLESLAAGVPCVMSPIAAEGIPWPDTLTGTIGAGAPQLAAHIVRLHASETEFTALGQAGLTFVAARCSDEAVIGGLRDIIQGRQAQDLPAAASRA